MDRDELIQKATEIIRHRNWERYGIEDVNSFYVGSLSNQHLQLIIDSYALEV